MEQNEGAYEQLRRLQAVTDAALTHLSLDELLDELLTRIRSIMEADTCAILLLDAEGDLVARAAKGLEEEVEQGVRIPVGQGFAGRIAAERRPLALHDLEQADILNPLIREKKIVSLLGAPLQLLDRVIGVVHVGTLSPRRFSQEDEELLKLVADRAALWIEKARVHDELVRLDQLKSNFISFAAHELRNPAAVVHGLSKTLLTLGDRHPEQSSQLRLALHDQSERLVHLLEQLLDLSRLEADSVAIQPEPIHMRATLDEIVARVAHGHAHEVSVEADSLEIRADRQAIERVVGNLVTNAFRHGAPPVRITAAGDNGNVQIAVEDSGSGVPDQFVPRLFEAFERHDRTRVESTGLGLAIALSYARAHGGDLAYEPREPRGSRFVFTLPSR